MKEFKYRSRPKEFKGVKETTYNENYKRFRRVNVPRMIYFMVLIFIAVSLVYYFADRNIFVSGKGLVLSDNLQMMVDEDVEIMELKVKAGDKVQAGDSLLAYYSKVQAKTAKDINSRIYKEKSSYDSDRRMYIKNIGLKRIKREHYKKKLEYALKKQKRTKEELKLNIAQRSELKKISDDIASYRLEIHYLSKEIVFLQQYIKDMSSGYLKSYARLNEEYNSIVGISYLKSPVSGTVVNILKKKGMPAYRNDPVIEINNGEGVAVVGYFAQKDLHHLKLSTVVKVYFSDGYTSMGIISEISEPTVFYDSLGEPQVGKDMKIKVKIVPYEGDGEEWSVRKGYFVKIKKYRNFFN